MFVLLWYNQVRKILTERGVFMGDLDIGGMLNRILPIFDYYITFFTRLLVNFAASLGIDLDLGNNEEDDVTPEEGQ